MALRDLWKRAYGRYQRSAANVLFQRPVIMRAEVPYISFTFDDFPRSALLTGGAILKQCGVAGTFYASLGLMGNETPTGTLFLPKDIEMLLEQGHELGCHTFAHCDAWETAPSQFEASVIENRRALHSLMPQARFKTFSYPKSPPRPSTKRKMADHFVCCRGGGQSLNVGQADLNYLRGFFLEQSEGNWDRVKEVILRNSREKGWLIFATHDVCYDYTPFGCTPAFLEQVVKWSIDSGARVVPVADAWEAIQGKQESPNVAG